MLERLPQNHGEMPLYSIGDMVISPQTDIPFGKQFRMGLAEYTIYDKATEEGYTAGVQNHLQLIQDLQCDPVALDDKQLAEVMQAFMPEGLTEHNQGVWRGAFIAGWFAVFLGVYFLDMHGE